MDRPFLPLRRRADLQLYLGFSTAQYLQTYSSLWSCGSRANTFHNVSNRSPLTKLVLRCRLAQVQVCTIRHLIHPSVSFAYKLSTSSFGTALRWLNHPNTFIPTNLQAFHRTRTYKGSGASPRYLPASWKFFLASLINAHPYTGIPPYPTVMFRSCWDVSRVASVGTVDSQPYLSFRTITTFVRVARLHLFNVSVRSFFLSQLDAHFLPRGLPARVLSILGCLQLPQCVQMFSVVFLTPSAASFSPKRAHNALWPESLNPALITGDSVVLIAFLKI
jgi:hypothetical protein